MKKTAGFTLIEMAVVLVIIGIILAGVMKGRDIVRGAQVKQFTQGFVQNWVATAANYYGVTGQRLFDGVANGGTDAAGPDGRLDFFYLGDESADGSGKDDERNDLLEALNDVGINACQAIQSKLNNWTASGCDNNFNPFTSLITGEFAGSQQAGVGFFNYPLTDNVVDTNVLVFANVPGDVARGIDTAIDGSADGETGKCLNITLNGGSLNDFLGVGSGIPVPPGGGFGPPNLTVYEWPDPENKVALAVIVD